MSKYYMHSMTAPRSMYPEVLQHAEKMLLQVTTIKAADEGYTVVGEPELIGRFDIAFLPEGEGLYPREVPADEATHVQLTAEVEVADR